MCNHQNSYETCLNCKTCFICNPSIKYRYGYCLACRAIGLGLSGIAEFERDYLGHISYGRVEEHDKEKIND